MNNKPINMITVLCDARRVQRVAITCRCGLRWIEFVPAELHDSQMICQFECPRDHTVYRLHNKVLTRVKEDTNGNEQEFAHITTTDADKRQYDS